MKSIFLFVFISILGFGPCLNGQVVYDFDEAKQIALAENKYIIVDFWATWCGPCKIMDRELWHSTEFGEVGEDFVLLKIDIDMNPNIKMQHGVTSIPRVFVMTANEDKLFDQTGFSSAEPFLTIFSAFPKQSGALSEALVRVVGADDPSYADLMEAGKALQLLGEKTEKHLVRYNILRESDDYFKTVEKKSDDPVLVMEAALYQILNNAHFGKHKKVQKELSKLKLDNQTAGLSDLKTFVMSYCYQCEGEMAKANELKEEIQDEALLSRLN